MIVVGIDPGTNVTGYGIVEIKQNRYHPIDYGCIRPPRSAKTPQKRQIIFQGLSHILEKHKPDAVAIETQFVKANAYTALVLGMVRGVAILAATSLDISVYEYAPTKVKKAVCHGRASKAQVQQMVQRLLNLPEIPPEDAADALALCICYLHGGSHV